jgi:hypothetical protein
MYSNAYGYGGYRPWGGGWGYSRPYLAAGIGYPYQGGWGYPGCYGGCGYGYYGSPYGYGGLL